MFGFLRTLRIMLHKQWWWYTLVLLYLSVLAPPALNETSAEIGLLVGLTYIFKFFRGRFKAIVVNSYNRWVFSAADPEFQQPWGNIREITSWLLLPPHDIRSKVMLIVSNSIWQVYECSDGSKKGGIIYSVRFPGFSRSMAIKSELSCLLITLCFFHIKFAAECATLGI